MNTTLWVICVLIGISAIMSGYVFFLSIMTNCFTELKAAAKKEAIGIFIRDDKVGFKRRINKHDNVIIDPKFGAFIKDGANMYIDNHSRTPTYIFKEGNINPVDLDAMVLADLWKHLSLDDLKKTLDKYNLEEEKNNPHFVKVEFKAIKDILALNEIKLKEDILLNTRKYQSKIKSIYREIEPKLTDKELIKYKAMLEVNK